MHRGPRNNDANNDLDGAISSRLSSNWVDSCHCDHRLIGIATSNTSCINVYGDVVARTTSQLAGSIAQAHPGWCLLVQNRAPVHGGAAGIIHCNWTRIGASRDGKSNRAWTSIESWCRHHNQHYIDYLRSPSDRSTLTGSVEGNRSGIFA